MGEGAIRTLGVEGIEAETLRANLADPTPAAQEKAASQLMTLSNERIGKPAGRAEVFNMTIEDAIASEPDSPLAVSARKSNVDAAVSATKADATQEKHDVAAGNRPPTTPQGGPVTPSTGPTPTEYAAATASQREQWKKDHVEVRV